MTIALSVTFVIAFAPPATRLPPVPQYETRYFPQTLDHFGGHDSKWAQRYLIADANWDGRGQLTKSVTAVEPARHLPAHTVLS